MTDIFASARGPMQARPFPLAPLLEVAGHPSLRRLALLLGVNGSALSRANATGLTWRQADTWACRIGKHPAEVWPSVWWSACDDDEMEEI